MWEIFVPIDMPRRPKTEQDQRRVYRKSTRNTYEWREKQPDRLYRMVRAWREGGRWFYSTCLVPKGRAAAEEAEWNWQEQDPAEIPLEDLRILREKLHAKYTRRRLPWEHVKEVDQLIAARGEEDEASDEEE